MTMRTLIMTNLFFAAALALAGTAGAGQNPASAVQTTSDTRAAFAETDTNHDGQIDIEEFHARLVEVFYRADKNKDGFLTEEEYVLLPFSGAMKNADANSDGRIALPEFVTIRFAQFQAADTNHDTQLSVEEAVAYEEGQK